MQNITEIIIDSRDYSIDDRITPDLIIEAISRMPQLSYDDARRIIDAMNENFPSLDIEAM